MKTIAAPARLNHTFLVRFRYSTRSTKSEYWSGLVLTGEAFAGGAVAEFSNVGPEGGAAFSEFAESAVAVVLRSE